MTGTPRDVLRWDALLRKRARELARPLNREGAERIPVLTFRLGRELLGIRAASVEGVSRVPHLLPVPGAPTVVAGVAVWRGDVLPVLDTAELMKIRRVGLDDRAWMVVVRRDRRLGLLTHAPGDIVAVDPAEMLPPRPERPGLTDFVEGVTPEGLGLVDTERLFTNLDQRTRDG